MGLLNSRKGTSTVEQSFYWQQMGVRLQSVEKVDLGPDDMLNVGENVLFNMLGRHNLHPAGSEAGLIPGKRLSEMPGGALATSTVQ